MTIHSALARSLLHAHGEWYDLAPEVAVAFIANQAGRLGLDLGADLAFGLYRGERMSFPPGPHWFAIRTNIKCEFRAQMGLEGAGMRTFVPRVTKWVTHARRQIVVKRPLLQRYIFAEIDPCCQSFETVRRTDGVELVVSIDGSPAIIPRELVEEFIQREMLGEFDLVRNEPLPSRATVKIVNGPWDEFFGVVIRNRRQGRSLFVKLIGRREAVHISGIDVRPAVKVA